MRMALLILLGTALIAGVIGVTTVNYVRRTCAGAGYPSSRFIAGIPMTAVCVKRVDHTEISVPLPRVLSP